MKKLIPILLALLLLTGCASNKTDTTTPDQDTAITDPAPVEDTVTTPDETPAANENASVKDVLLGIFEGVDLPDYDLVELDSETFEYFAFAKYVDGIEGVSADALVSINPHSVVLVKTPDGMMTQIAEEIAANADPVKWVCVNAEAGKVLAADNYVMLVMSDPDTTDALVNSFNNYFSNTMVSSYELANAVEVDDSWWDLGN